YRYFDRTRILKIGELQPGMEYVQISGTLGFFDEQGEGAKRRLTATLSDGSGRIGLLWFQARAAVRNALKEGQRYIVFGKINWFNGEPSIAHPDVEPLNAETTRPGMQPMYSSTQKLITRGITNRSFAKLTQALFQQL